MRCCGAERGAIAGEPAAYDYRAVPAVVFTDPEIAWCGLTEAEAKRQGREVKAARFPWGASGRAATLGRQELAGAALPWPGVHEGGDLEELHRFHPGGRPGRGGGGRPDRDPSR